MKRTGAVAAIVSLVAAVAMVAPVRAGATPQGTFAAGAVIALSGTPHLWIADDGGVLHWAGDTRALAGKSVNWGSRIDVSMDQLRSFRRGDPWLSAGLLKDGDPIYLVKWESGWSVPELHQIQSIGDVELFGIDGSNYGRFVLNRDAWERQFGVGASGLTRKPLAAAVTPAAVPPPPAAPAPAQSAPAASAPPPPPPSPSGPAYYEVSDTVRVSPLNAYRLPFNLVAGDALRVSFAEATGKDIMFYIVAPDLKTRYEYGRPNGLTADFTARMSGTHYVYFDNGYSLLTSKTVQYTITYPGRP